MARPQSSNVRGANWRFMNSMKRMRDNYLTLYLPFNLFFKTKMNMSVIIRR